MISAGAHFSVSDHTPFPVEAGYGGTELRYAAEQRRARSVTGHDLETTLKAGARLPPVLAPIGGECGAKGIAQRQALATDFAFATEQFEDALRLGLADYQDLIDLAGLHQIGGETVGSFENWNTPLRRPQRPRPASLRDGR